VARNAFEGLEAIKNTLPDLVLSDIKMPGKNGFELLEEIRALDPDAGGSVPVIAMSAFFSQTASNAHAARRFSGMFAEAIHPRQISLKTGMAGVETAQATQHQTNPIAPRWTFRVRTH
jgi:CheY-like chemotaxis protein